MPVVVNNSGSETETRAFRKLNMQPHLNHSTSPTPDGNPVGPMVVVAGTPASAKQKDTTQRRKATGKNRVTQSSGETHLSGETHSSAETQPTDAASDSLSLDRIQLQLQTLLASTVDRAEFINECVAITSRLTNAIWCGHFQRNDESQFVCNAQHSSIAQGNLGIHQSSLLPTVGLAIESRQSRINQDGELTVIAAPIFTSINNKVTSNECLCLALNLGTESPEPFLLIAQMIASTLTQRHTQDEATALDWQIDSTTAVAELMSKIIHATGPRAAAIVATNELATFLNSPLVVIGYVSNESSCRTRVQSVSGVTEIDGGGKQTRLLQSVLNETLLREKVTTIPSIQGDGKSLKLAHRRLIESHPDSRIVSSPLKTSDGRTIGAWLCVLPNNAQQHEQLAQFANVTSDYLADALHAKKQASRGAVNRLGSQANRFFAGKVGRMVLAAIAAVTMVMMIPVSHRVACDCQLEPTVRRFAVAPHDGILLESFVKPGDVVTAGQVIARMDDRELILQTSDLHAQRETARKKRDVNRSARDAAATQIAELEIEQLDAKIDLINFKKNNLEIKSAVDGIVLQGELEDAQGAPVRTGDVLIEVAPLDALRIELNVPESDIAYVDVDQAASIVLDGTPFEPLAGTIGLIRPASEVRDNKNVFVSEIEIDNSARLLRPGMQGRAKIAAGSKPLGWVLFHRPAERVYKMFR
jgi:multidrug resistance efflux pump